MAQVKICGLTSEAAVEAVNKAGVEYAGFIYFHRSPRHLEPARAAELRSKLANGIKAVSVLVDPADELLAMLASSLKPNFFQLHGKETPERVKAIKTAYPAIKIIKAISVSNGDDIAASLRYGSVADMFLFDAKPPKGMLPGGNALSFDWALLKGREFSLPWMLSGGLTPENVADSIRLSGAKMVDVSSGVESAPGVKDPALIDAFAKAAHVA